MIAHTYTRYDHRKIQTYRLVERMNISYYVFYSIPLLFVDGARICLSPTNSESYRRRISARIFFRPLGTGLVILADVIPTWQGKEAVDDHRVRGIMRGRQRRPYVRASL